MAQSGYKPTDIIYLTSKVTDENGEHDVIGVTLGVPGTYAHNSYQAFCRDGQCTVYGPLHRLYAVTYKLHYQELHAYVSNQFFPGETLNVLNNLLTCRGDSRGRVVVVDTPTFQGLAVVQLDYPALHQDGFAMVEFLSGPSSGGLTVTELHTMRLATVKDFETYRVSYHPSYEAIEAPKFPLYRE